MDLVISGLAVWRLSEMLVHEAGPWNVFGRLREWSGVLEDADGNVSLVKNSVTPLNCVLCTSIWVAGLAVVSQKGLRPKDATLSCALWRVLSVSGFAVLIEKVCRWMDGDC